MRWLHTCSLAHSSTGLEENSCGFLSPGLGGVLSGERGWEAEAGEELTDDDEVGGSGGGTATAENVLYSGGMTPASDGSGECVGDGQKR